MICNWCSTNFPGQTLIEEVCLACIVEDTIPEDFVVFDDPDYTVDTVVQ